MADLNMDDYMVRAIQLAVKGKGQVSPNPMVGCVIVSEDDVIGEGYHQRFGQEHAEVNAINSVQDRKKLEDATLYVTLEPCNHFGKTPPCTDLIIRSKIPTVVIGALDPNPIVNGNGVRRLREAGIKVETGIKKEEAEELNREFNTFYRKGRPYVILKWAQTADGFIARENNDSKWISSERSRQLVHRWRSESDAILVGKNTVLHDNPLLNVRSWKGRDPLKIVLDPQMSLETGVYKLFEHGTTLVVNGQKNGKINGVEFLKVGNEHFLTNLLSQLHERKMQSVFVEGGTRTINHFLEQNLWDEARVFTALNTFEKGITAPKINLNPVRSERVSGDTLHYYNNEHSEG